MIHSMCGGGLKDNEIFSFAKVKFVAEKLPCGVDGERPYWFISEIPLLKQGDKVLAPVGMSDVPCEAVVLRVDRASEQTPPFPIKTMKKIIKKL